MVVHPGQKNRLFNSNCNDIDRRHLWSVKLNGDRPEQWTRGDGIEWSPVMLSEGQTFACLASGATFPARAVISDFGAKSKPSLASETWPKDFPSDRLVVPQQAIFKSADGLELHAQLFVPSGLKSGEKRPALIFLHGGSMRQMLLGWHYMYYYSNSYAMNQYLASRGYVVLALNYRSGNRLRPRLSRSPGPRGPRRKGVRGRRGGRKIFADPQRRGRQTHRTLGRKLRRLLDRARTGA